MGDALAEAQLQQAGNQFWGGLLATVVSAGYFTFIMQHLRCSWFDFMLVLFYGIAQYWFRHGFRNPTPHPPTPHPTCG